jgi:hypothetical protein
MKCVQKDDFEAILEQLVRADAYVLVSPTYLLGAHSVLKRFLDRGLSFYRHIDALWGKPAVGAVVAGFPGMEGYSKVVVDSFIKLTLAEHRGSEVIYAALPGEVLLHEEGKEAARQLAEALVTRVLPATGDSSTPRCPLCGGDTFRFLDNGKVRCMLCSSGGSYDCQAEQLRFETKVGEHPLFLTREYAKNHLAYLQGLKEKFLADRRPLKLLVRDYGEDGNWISPPARD